MATTDSRTPGGGRMGWLHLLRSYLPSVYVLFAVILVGFLIDRQYMVIDRQEEREAVRRQVATIRAQLEGHLNAPIQAVRGLVATLSTEPDMDQARFSMLAEQVTDRNSGVLNIAGARDMVINLLHPYDRNASALGLDYNRNDAQRRAAFRVRDSGQFILAGPVDLVQGGRGFVGRFPVFVPGENNQLSFWGLTSVVIDLPWLFQKAGVVDPDSTLELAIVGADGTGAAGPLFHGKPEVIWQDPITTDILFPNGSWELYAVPKGGWGNTHLAAVRSWRAVLVVFGATVVAMTLLANRLASQREGMIDQLSERERQLEELNRQAEIQALHDHLTQLPNRRFLDRRLAELARGQREFPGLIQVDLDGFKDVNDQYGHAVGDTLLTQVADRFRAVLGPEDFLARIGGDEFVVLCLPADGTRPLDARDYLEALARRLIESVTHPFLVAGQSQRIGLSAGILPDPHLSALPSEWLSHADRAMYLAKQEGRNRFVTFRPAQIGVGDQTPRARANALLEALAEGRIRPFYQPQFAADGRTLVGAEALARWEDPSLGLITPAGFMNIARNLKVDGEIDQQIFDQATAQMALWDAEGLHLPRVSVNVSFRQLNDPGLIARLGDVSVRPERVAMELLESVYLDEGNAQLTRNVNALVERGFQIEIDDFGTGFSSIVSLLKLRPRRLKIDRMLVQGATRSPENRRLLATIVDMGRALEIEVCAEGIETRAQLLTARAVGCNVMQGFFLARPMSAEDMGKFLREQQCGQAGQKTYSLSR